MTEISTLGLLAASAKEANNAGQAGKKASALMAAATIWNGRFAPERGQQILPRGQLVSNVKNALHSAGAKVRSVETWIGHGSRMALTHGAEIERSIRTYVNDPTRNSDATLAGAVKAVLAWVNVEFATLETMVEQTDTRVAKTADQKDAAKLAALCNAINACKNTDALLRFAELAMLKADLLGKNGNVSPETRAASQARVAALVGSFKPQDELDQEAEIAAEMLEEAEDVARAAAEEAAREAARDAAREAAREAAVKQQEAVNTALAMMDHAAVEAKRVA